MREVAIVLGAALVGGAVVLWASKNRSLDADADMVYADMGYEPARDVQWRNHPSNRNWTPRVLN